MSKAKAFWDIDVKQRVEVSSNNQNVFIQLADSIAIELDLFTAIRFGIAVLNAANIVIEKNRSI